MKKKCWPVPLKLSLFHFVVPRSARAIRYYVARFLNQRQIDFSYKTFYHLECCGYDGPEMSFFSIYYWERGQTNIIEVVPLSHTVFPYQVFRDLKELFLVKDSQVQCDWNNFNTIIRLASSPLMDVQLEWLKSLGEYMTWHSWRQAIIQKPLAKFKLRELIISTVTNNEHTYIQYIGLYLLNMWLLAHEENGIKIDACGLKQTLKNILKQPREGIEFKGVKRKIREMQAVWL